MTTDETGNVVGMAGAAEYQDGAVVSRTLIKHKTGSVTVFAFDAGQELSEHTVPFDALVHVIDGAVEIRIDGDPHVVRSGESIVMPAGHPHAVKAIERFRMVLSMVRAE
jgi:quercetin dioxygenase-like cupin family protein